jgi:hypothetical protein
MDVLRIAHWVIEPGPEADDVVVVWYMLAHHQGFL